MQTEDSELYMWTTATSAGWWCCFYSNVSVWHQWCIDKKQSNVSRNSTHDANSRSLSLLFSHYFVCVSWWSWLPSNHTFYLLPRHGVSPCSATLHECQMK